MVFRPQRVYTVKSFQRFKILSAMVSGNNKYVKNGQLYKSVFRCFISWKCIILMF